MAPQASLNLPAAWERGGRGVSGGAVGATRTLRAAHLVGVSQATLVAPGAEPTRDLWLRWGWGLLLVPMSKPEEDVRVSVQEKLLGEKAGSLCP